MRAVAQSINNIKVVREQATPKCLETMTFDLDRNFKTEAIATELAHLCVLLKTLNENVRMH